jgi:hypothetical protein
VKCGCGTEAVLELFFLTHVDREDKDFAGKTAFDATLKHVTVASSGGWRKQGKVTVTL